MKIICKLKDLMDSQGVRSLSEVQRQTKLARRTLDKLYYNHSNQVSYETMVTLCMFFECDLSDLFQMVSDGDYQEYIDYLSKRKESVRKGFVYFIKSNKTNLIKIGKTNDVDRRLRDLSDLYNEKLELLKIIETNNAYILERTFHEKFSDNRVMGEWFELNVDELLEKIG